jgi:hypothetical protein
VDFLGVSGRLLELQRASCLEEREANLADSYGSRSESWGASRWVGLVDVEREPPGRRRWSKGSVPPRPYTLSRKVQASLGFLGSFKELKKSAHIVESTLSRERFIGL